MPISLSEILQLRSGPKVYRWGQLETIRYALGLGYGTNAVDPSHLRFTYEKNLKAVPTQCAVAAWGIGPDRALMGIDYSKLLHGEQSVVLHGPFPAAAEITAEAWVSAVYDKGPGKGAVIVTDTALTAADGQRLADLRATLFARADGGFGGSNEGAPAPHPLPDRSPDRVLELTTRTEQALVYRLNGDLNPLHSDPDVAASAGFPRPILHGLCTYGLACRAVMEAFTGGEPEPVKSHAARFAAPLYPGETLVLEFWQDDGVISFRGRSRERSLLVLNNGRTELR